MQIPRDPAIRNFYFKDFVARNKCKKNGQGQSPCFKWKHTSRENCHNGYIDAAIIAANDEPSNRAATFAAPNGSIFVTPALSSLKKQEEIFLITGVLKLLWKPSKVFF